MSTTYRGQLHFTKDSISTKYNLKLKSCINNTLLNCTKHTSLNTKLLGQNIVDRTKKDSNGIFLMLEEKDDLSVSVGDINKDFPLFICEECVRERETSLRRANEIYDSKMKILQIVFELFLKDVPVLSVSSTIEELYSFDPEYLLKVALFCRRELNVRTVSNFLLGLSAYLPDSVQFLQKYFVKCIFTPNDWLEVVYYFMRISGSTSLPAQLRKVLIKKFLDFSVYQIGKYKSKKFTVNIKNKCMKLDLKNMVRILHISNPVEPVMCIIGKKYPMDINEFIRSRLDGTFDSTRAGKRMKIPIPDTWETQISMQGNIKEVWQKLIDKKSLPYMAMIRNLRNLLMVNLDEKYHDYVVKLICKEDSVIRGKMLPFQYVTAFKVLDDYQEDVAKVRNEEMKLYRVEVYSKRASAKERKLKKLIEKLKGKAVSSNIIERYKSSLTKAIKIASLHNIPPIRGKLLIIANLSDSMVTVSKFGFRKPRNELTALTVSLCYMAAEYSKIYVQVSPERIIEYDSKNIKKSILTVSEELLKLLTFTPMTADKQFSNIIEENVHFDTVILFDIDVDPNLLNSYINYVNRKVRIYRVIYGKDEVESLGISSVLDIYGLNEQSLKLISEESNGGIVTTVEKIDRKYKLEDINVDICSSASNISSLAKLSECETVTNLFDLNADMSYARDSERLKTINVFISSTFLDMGDERNYINRVFIPKLKQWIYKKYNNLITLTCIDLRWGIPKEWSDSERVLDYCLENVIKCDIFIGIYGHRYGWIPSSKLLHKLKDKYDGLEKCAGRSITELEYVYAPDDDKCYYFLYDGPSQNTDRKLERFRGFIDHQENTIRYDNIEMFKESTDNVFDAIVGRLELESIETPQPCLIHNIHSRILKLHYYQASFFEKGKDATSYVSYRTQEVDDIITLLEHSMGIRLLEYRKKLNFEMKMNISKKNTSTVEETDVPGGILLLTGKPRCGKTTMLIEIIDKLMKQATDSDKNKCDANTYFIWRSEFIQEMNAQLSRSLSLFDLLLDLICFLVTKNTSLIGFLKKKLIDFKEINLSDDHFWIPDNLRKATLIWKAIMESLKIPKSKKFYIFLDDLECIPNQSEVAAFNWLPLIIPSNIRFIITASDTTPFIKTLKNRKDCFEHQIRPIPLNYRRSVIQKIFKQFGKVLSESAFDNQLMELVLKKESANLHYLLLSGNYLVNFGEFENLSAQIKNIPNTLPKLVLHTLSSLEKEIRKEIIIVYLSFLSASQIGFRLDHLQRFMGIYFGTAKSKNMMWLSNKSFQAIDDSFSRQPICPSYPLVLINNMSGIISQNSQGQFFIKHYLKALIHQYISKVNKPVINYIISRCFESLNGKTLENETLPHLLYYKLEAGLYEECYQALTDVNFLKSMFTIGAAENVLHYYSDDTHSTNNTWRCFQSCQKFIDYKRFILKNFRDLIINPNMIFQLSVSENEHSLVRCDPSLYNRVMKFGMCDEEDRTGIVIWPVTQWPRDKVNADKEMVVDDAVVCCTLDEMSSLLYIALANGLMQAVDLNSLKIVQNMRYHFATVNSMKLYYNEFESCRQLISCDNMGNVVVWNLNNETGAVIKKELHGGHEKGVPITDCDNSSDCAMICTAGLDSKVVFWNHIDYHIAQIYKTNSPINCIKVCPTRQNKVLIGCWDGNILLYNISDQKRVGILHQDLAVKSISMMCDKTNDLVGEIFMTTDICGTYYEWNAVKGFMCSRPVQALPTNTPISGEYLDDGGSSILLFGGSNSSTEPTVLYNKLTTNAGGCHELDFITCIDFSEYLVVYGTSSGILKYANYGKMDDVTSVHLCTNELRHVVIHQTSIFERRFVAVDYIGNVYIVENGNQSRCLFANIHSGQVSCVKLTSDTIISGGEDCNLNFRNVSDTEMVQTEKVFSSTITCLSLFKDTYCIAASRDRSIALYDLSDRSLIEHKTDCHDDWIIFVEFSKKCFIFVSASRNSILKLWTIKENKFSETHQLNVGVNCGLITSVTKYLSEYLISFEDGNIQIVNEKLSISDNFKLINYSTRNHVTIKKAQCTNNGTFYILDADNLLYEFYIQRGYRAELVLDHIDSVTDVAVGNGSIYTVSMDKHIKKWITNNSLIKKISDERIFVTKMVALNFKERYQFVTCHIDQYVAFWNYDPQHGLKIAKEVNLKECDFFGLSQYADYILCQSMKYDHLNSSVVFQFMNTEIVLDLKTAVLKSSPTSESFMDYDEDENFYFTEPMGSNGETLQIDVRNTSRIMMVTLLKDDQCLYKTEKPLNGQVSAAVKLDTKTPCPVLILAYVNGSLEVVEIKDLASPAAMQ